jgi:hypothetical protein
MKGRKSKLQSDPFGRLGKRYFFLSGFDGGMLFWLAVRGTGERELDVGNILLAQPAQQGTSIIIHIP